MKYLIAVIIVGWVITKIVKKWNLITIIEPGEYSPSSYSASSSSASSEEEEEAYTVAPPIEEVLKGRK